MSGPKVEDGTVRSPGDAGEVTVVIVMPSAPSTKQEGPPTWILVVMFLAVVIFAPIVCYIWPSEPPPVWPGR